ERLALMVLALALIAGLLGKRMVPGLIMAFLVLLIGSVGADPRLGIPRFTFGNSEFLDGINFTAAVMGLFGISEVLLNTEQRITGLISASVRSILPTRDDIRRSIGPVIRGTGIGIVLGLIPGATSV